MPHFDESLYSISNELAEKLSSKAISPSGVLKTMDFNEEPADAVDINQYWGNQKVPFTERAKPLLLREVPYEEAELREVQLDLFASDETEAKVLKG